MKPEDACPRFFRLDALVGHYRDDGSVGVPLSMNNMIEVIDNIKIGIVMRTCPFAHLWSLISLSMEAIRFNKSLPLKEVCVAAVS